MTIKKEKLSIKQFLSFDKDKTATIRFLPYEEPSYYHYFDKAWVDKAMEVSKECPICEAEIAFSKVDDYADIIGSKKQLAAVTETGREVLNKTLHKLYGGGLISKDMLKSSMGVTDKALDLNLDDLQEDLFSAPEMHPMTIEQELVDARRNYYKDNQGHAGNSSFGLFQQSISPKKNSYVGEDPLESMLLPPTPVAVEAWRKLVGR